MFVDASLSRMHAVPLRLRRLCSSRLDHQGVCECAEESDGYEWPNLDWGTAWGRIRARSVMGGIYRK